MLRKTQVYQVALIAWALVSGLTVIAVYTGVAEPLVGPSALPGERWYAFPLIGVLWAAGFLAVTVRKRRTWRRAGRAANLTPEGGGLLGGPDLTGTVHGRRVRAHTVKRHRNDRDGSGAVTIAKDTGENSSATTYTVVETELATPMPEGLLVGRGDGDETGFGGATAASRAIDDEIAVAGGGSDALAEALGTRPVRDTLLDVEVYGTLTVGDPAHTVLDAIPDMSGSMIGGALQGKVEERVEEQFPGEATTVASETRGLLLDPAELERHAAAVVAVADAADKHRGSAPE